MLLRHGIIPGGNPENYSSSVRKYCNIAGSWSPVSCELSEKLIKRFRLCVDYFYQLAL
jgi:hypothetical protein